MSELENNTLNTLDRNDSRRSSRSYLFQLLHNYPITLLVTFCTLVLHLELWFDTPELISYLQLQFESSFIQPLFPQIFTGNFVHWSTGHLLTDLSAYMLLGLLFERRDSLSFLAATLIGAIGTSLAVWVFHPDVSAYRGLSGVNHGLLAYGFVSGIRRGNMRDIVLGLLFLVKLTWEVSTGVLVLPTGNTFSHAFAEFSHAGGAVGGTIVALFLFPVSGNWKKNTKLQDRAGEKFIGEQKDVENSAAVQGSK